MPALCNTPTTSHCVPDVGLPAEVCGAAAAIAACGGRAVSVPAPGVGAAWCAGRPPLIRGGLGPVNVAGQAWHPGARLVIAAGGPGFGAGRGNATIEPVVRGHAPPYVYGASPANIFQQNPPGAFGFAASRAPFFTSAGSFNPQGKKSAC